MLIILLVLKPTCDELPKSQKKRWNEKKMGRRGQERYRWRKDLGEEIKGWKSLKEKEKNKTKK
jgi:hypothetical protein